MTSFPIRRASAGMAVVLLLGFLIPMIAGPGDGDEARSDLPADLALIPHDALGFSTFRVADLLANQQVKHLLPLLRVSHGETLI